MGVMIYLSMMAYKFENLAILNIKGIDYRCAIWNMSKSDAINRLNKSELDDKDPSWIWTLLQINVNGSN